MTRAPLLVASLAISLAVSSAGCGSAPPPQEPCSCEAAPPPEPIAGPCTEGYPYELPRTVEAPLPPGSPAETPGVMVVIITADGVVRVGNQPLDLAALARVARERHAKEPDVRAVIHADRATPWRSVVEAIDGIKSGGIAKLAFGVAPMGG